MNSSSKARDYFRLLAKLASNNYEDENIAAIYHHLAQIELTAFCLDDAFKYYKLARTIKEKRFPSSNHSAIIQSNLTLAHIFTKQDNHRKALFVLKTLLDECKTDPKYEAWKNTLWFDSDDAPAQRDIPKAWISEFDKSMLMSVLYGYIGYCYVALGKYGVSKRHFDEQRHIYLHTGIIHPIDCATSLTDAADILLEASHHDTALDYYYRAYDILTTTLPYAHQSAIDIYTKLSQAFLRCHKCVLA
ncbi:unnamed protein product, partial [Didymodactylos carnosus]